MTSVQDRTDTRGIPLKRAGIKGFKIPVKIKDNGTPQNTVATVNIFASLPQEKKGIHLSKLVDAVLELTKDDVSEENIKKMTEMAKGESDYVEIDMEFVYFLVKNSPVTKIPHPLDYKCRYLSQIISGVYFLTKEVIVPVTTLCPESKEHSRYGAHNQRSFVSIRIRNSNIGLKDLIEIAEQNSSCEIYQVLNNVDDKFVTEKAYENPMFVEDIVRKISVKLQKNKRINWYKVSSENLESNHNYNAFAEAEGGQNES